MAVGPERATVDPGVGNGIDDLLPAASQHPRHDRRGRDPHQQDMIQPDPVEAVFQRDDSLDLVGLDHRRQHVSNGQRVAALGDGLAAEVIGDGEDTAQVVGGMTPLRRQPRIVEIEPPHDGADIERPLDRIQLPARAGYATSTWHGGAGHHRTEELGAGRVIQGLESAGQGVHETVTRRFVRHIAGDVGLFYVIGDVRERRVRIGSFRGSNIH